MADATLPTITPVEVIDWELKGLGERIRKRAGHLRDDFAALNAATDRRLETTGLNLSEMQVLVSDVSEFQTLTRVRKTLTSPDVTQ